MQETNDTIRIMRCSNCAYRKDLDYGMVCAHTMQPTLGINTCGLFKKGYRKGLNLLDRNMIVHANSMSAMKDIRLVIEEW